jgi:hypothetical protein
MSTPSTPSWTEIVDYSAVLQAKAILNMRVRVELFVKVYRYLST